MDGGVDGICQPNAFTIVGQSRIRKFTGTHPAKRRIFGVKGRLVMYHDDKVIGGECHITEGKVDPVGKADQVQVDRLGADVLQFKVFGIGVAVRIIRRMIHNLSIAEISRNRSDTEGRHVQRTPGSAFQYAGLDLDTFRQRDGAGINHSTGFPNYVNRHRIIGCLLAVKCFQFKYINTNFGECDIGIFDKFTRIETQVPKCDSTWSALQRPGQSDRTGYDRFSIVGDRRIHER